MPTYLRNTPFTGANNGFQFDNTFVTDVSGTFGNFQTKGLCGGMSYAALDYYLAGMRVPATGKELPSSRSPARYSQDLYNYIFGQQVASYSAIVPRIFNAKADIFTKSSTVFQ
jgi:hypothetical protein